MFKKLMVFYFELSVGNVKPEISNGIAKYG